MPDSVEVDPMARLLLGNVTPELTHTAAIAIHSRSIGKLFVSAGRGSVSVNEVMFVPDQFGSATG